MNRDAMLLPSLLVVALGVSRGAINPQGQDRGGIAYDVRGSGPLVVLLTGSNLDRRMWDREAEWLSKSSHRRALRPARARRIRHRDEGVHASRRSDRRCSTTLKIEKATLIGLSAGSYIALDAALESPDRVERIVLAGPGSAVHTEECRRRFRRK